jgi:uroporphyrinogen-III synthase
MKKVLITAEPDEANLMLENLSEIQIKPFHLPLEQFEYATDPDQHEALLQQLDSFQFVVYGGLKNARHFLTWMHETDAKSKIREKINVILNKAEADLLEAEGIPAIQPKKAGKPIDILEFLLRISLNGAVLYPCAEASSEEIPGLLEEMEMPVAEFMVCRSVPFDKEEIEEKRNLLKKADPDTILFHSRSSVIRTKAAFPGLDLESCILVAASAGVAHKMRQENLEPDLTASGSWKS